MKLRHILLAAATVLAASAGAKNADELRIYVNPGHGSWTGGDRAMATIAHGPYNSTNTPDTTGFFESNTNLWKCLSIVDKLEEYGLKIDRTLNQDNPNPARRGAALDMRNNIVMSHVKLGPYPLNSGDDEAYNRDLYEIACEVERGNFDFFISVHSNAHEDGKVTNYPALFVRGENKTASITGADDAARTFWPYAYQDQHQCWSNYSMTNPGLYYDIDFWSGDYLINNIDGKSYKGYYGVLRHGVIGFLCEGYFHTYQPGRHRAMNMDVCRHEGTGYAHGLAAIFGLQTEAYGELYGIVRDKHERFHHTYYNCSALSPDALKPLNGAEVTLYKDGQPIDNYTTDGEWNGAFVFPRLEPGEYTISVKAEGYKDAEPEYCGPFTVEASKTTYPRVYLESESYEPPAVVYYDYPDEAADATVFAGDEFAFQTTVSDKAIAELAGKTVRRVVERNGMLYVLAVDAERKPTVLVLDGTTLDVKATLGTDGTEGTEYAISDIQVTSDGVLIGCSQELCHLTDDQVGEDAEPGVTETRGVCNIYRWANDDKGTPEGQPTIWFTTMLTGNLYKAWTGGSMAYTGTSQEGRLILSSASFYYNRKVFFSLIDVMEGKKASESISNKGDVCDYFNVDDLGDFTLNVSPLSSESLICFSPISTTRQYDFPPTALQAELSTELMPVASAQGGMFRFAGRSMLAVPDVDADGANTGLRLLDISDGLDKARLMATTNTSMEAKAGVSAATGRTDVTRDDEGNVTAAYITLYTVRGDGLVSRLTTRGVEQPVREPAYAYGLTTQQVPGGATELTFILTADARAHIELVPDDDTLELVTVGEGEYAKGQNTVDINDIDIPAGIYTWRVVVENETVAGIKALYKDGSVAGNGVAVDDCETSPFFGNVYFSLNSGDRGILQYSPDMTAANTTPYQAGVWDLSVGASCWRMATLDDGIVLVADWGDKAGGIYIFDPADPTAARRPLFKGTQKPSSGEITNAEGKVIAGSTSGMWPLGKGDDMVLYSFQEDYPSDYTLTMVSYNMGSRRELTTEPETTYDKLSPYLINGNVNVVAHEKGLFLSQTRGSGNNAKGVPVFLISDYEQNILFNSGADWATLNGGDGALAVNREGTRMAVSDATENIHICSLTWEPEFKLEVLYSFTPEFGGSTYQMAFDRAGRLYVANRGGYAVYAIPQDASTAVTASESKVHGAGSGVADITVDAAEASAEYFNLQGIRVAADALTPGIYIERRGTSARKVVIK